MNGRTPNFQALLCRFLSIDVCGELKISALSVLEPLMAMNPRFMRLRTKL